MQLPKTHMGMSLHNYFEIKVIDSITQEVKQEARAENTICPQAFTALFRSNSVQFLRPQLAGLSLEDNLEDLTTIYNPMYTYARLGTKESASWVDPYTALQVAKFTFSATTSWVGDYNCIFVMQSNDDAISYTYFSTYGISKALIKDAEGNTITLTKTDLDIVEVTYYFYISISSNVEYFKIFPYSRVLQATIDTSTAMRIPGFRYQDTHVYLSGLTTENTQIVGDNNSKSIICFFNDTYYREHPWISRQAAASYSSGVISVTFPRIARDYWKVPHYIHYMYFSMYAGYVGYIQLPNNELFPNYTLAPLPVGIGDGTTTHYELPLPYFIPNTEIISIGERQLIRDVDYTIDPYTNYPWYQEVNPWTYCQCTPLRTATSRYLDFYPVFYHNASILANCYNPSDGDLIFSYVDKGLGYPKTINYWSMSNLFCGISRSNMAGLKFILSYSQDGQSWTECATLQVPSNYTTLEYYTASSYRSFQLNTEFTPVDANYWKIHFDFSEAAYPGISTSTFFSGSDSSTGSAAWAAQAKGETIYLGYKGAGINFIIPPEENAEITMTVQMDRPYKTTDYVIDVGYTMEVSM